MRFRSLKCVRKLILGRLSELLVISLRVLLLYQMLDDKGNTAVYLLYAYTRIR